MAISDNILKKMKQVRTDLTNGDPTSANEIQDKAVKAILAGAKKDDGTPTQEWINYMSMFATDQAELDKLMPEPDNVPGSSERNLSRSYLAGNGPCGAATAGYILIWGVGENLD
jgi:hypothetical protein